MESAKDAVQGAVEGVKNLAVSNEQKPQKEKKDKKKKGGDEGGRPMELDPQPAYFDHRIQILLVEQFRYKCPSTDDYSEKLKAKHDEEVAQKPRGMTQPAQSIVQLLTYPS
jgi:threonyl-tRNA synthetase